MRVVQGRTGFLVEVEVVGPLREGYDGAFILPGSFVDFRTPKNLPAHTLPGPILRDLPENP